MKTNKTIEYTCASYGHVATIPKGTKVIPATNLPLPLRFWVENLDNMTDLQESYYRNYGFLINAEDVAWDSEEI